MQILLYPVAELRQKVAPVTREMIESDDFKTKLTELTELAKLDGLGIAANQCNWPINLFIATVDRDLNKLSEPRVYVNPTIELESKTMVVAEEGCLSFPGLILSIPRPGEITWTFEDLLGTKYQAMEKYADTKSGYFIRLVQHEIDHLTGKLLIDRVSPTKRLKFDKWLKDRK